MTSCIRLLPGLAVLLLGGCAAVTEPLGMEDPFAIPRPFAGVARNDAMLTPAIDTFILQVDIPADMDPLLAGQIRDRILSVFDQRDVPAVASSTIASWELKGRAARVVTSGKSAPPFTLIVWRLFDPAKVQQGQFTVRFSGEDAATMEPRLAVLAEEVASRADELLRPGRAGTPGVRDATAPVPVMIGSIRGAPGDGNTALVTGLKAALPMQGLKVEAQADRAAWRIECVVSVKPHSKTEDVVTLTWRVLDATGKERGTMSQDNTVPSGRLKKPWGEIAGYASEAAAEGILSIIQQVQGAQAD